MKNAALLILFCVWVSISARSQKNDTDSLIRALAVYPHQDTLKVTLLTSIAMKSWRDEPERSLQLAQAALKLSEELGHQKGVADAYIALSKYYWSQTDHQQVITYAHKAATIYESQNNLKKLASCYSLIGLGYSQARIHDKAIHYHTLARESNESIRNTSGIARDLNNLGCEYELTHDYSSALDCYQQALSVWQQMNEEDNVNTALSNIGNVYLLTGDHELAKKHLSQTLERVRKTGNKNQVAYVSQNLGVAYYKTRDYDKAEALLHDAIRIADEIGDKRRKEEAYQAMVDLEESRGNFQAALQYLRRLQWLKDSLYSEQQIRQSAEMEARYQSEKKQQEIELLEERHKVGTLWRNMLLTGLVLTIMASVAIYRLQRSRAHKAKLLFETQELMVRQLEDGDKLKSRLFTNISHEFRTPLTLILTPIEDRLSIRDIPDKDRAMFQSIQRSAKRLLELINQLLDLSRLESGFAKLHPEPGNLNGFMLPLISAFDSLAEVNGIDYKKEVMVSNDIVLFDADKLEKILVNLLSNAFKFTGKNGAVQVGVSTRDTGAGVDLKLIVTNTTFAPLEVTDQIFEPFVRGTSHSVAETPGTGLGLSLVKELVKLNNGQVRLVSHSTREVTFIVDLSFGKTDLPEVGHERFNNFPSADAVSAASEHQPPDANKETVLIVEDNSEMRGLIRRGLQDRYYVLEASTGKLGLDLLEDQHADIVVADVMMPVMDGIELCKRIKNNESTSHIPVILLTARADQQSKLEGLLTGADDYIVKPFNLQELNTRIQNLIDQRKRLIRKYNQHHELRPMELTANKIDEHFAARLTALLEQNLDNTLFDLTVMSRELGISRTNLHRKIKAITGLAPGEFLQDFRLRKAAGLIERKADLISQIAYRVGFSDQSYFSKCFKKKFGKNPSEYAGNVSR